MVYDDNVDAGKSLTFCKAPEDDGWEEKNKKVSKGKTDRIEVSQSSCVLVCTHPFVVV